MSWTYDPTLLTSAIVSSNYPPATVGVRYQIRLLLQDNQSARPLLQDEEIDWFQTTEANAYMAAAACCESLIARAGSVKVKKIGDASLTYDPSFYKGLKIALQARGMTYQVPYCGGISIADKTAQQVNQDAVVPLFFKHFADNPNADTMSPGASTSSSVNNPNAL